MNEKGGCPNMLSECRVWFDKLETLIDKLQGSQASMLKDYVTDIEANRSETRELRMEIAEVKRNQGVTHDSVTKMEKDIEYMRKTEEKREDERKEEKKQKIADRRLMITVLVSSFISLLGIAISLITNLFKG